jgi:glutathionylspermidine synthase
MILDYFKWDPQVGDESVLFPQPLILDSKNWQKLARAAEQMALELTRVESVLFDRADLQAALGLPRPLIQALKNWTTPQQSSSLRVLRFDFHATTDGWKISEVNSDVPGGFTESSNFTALMAGLYPSTHSPGNPCEAWKHALTSLPGVKNVGILYASGYSEDQQVASFLGWTVQTADLRPYFIQHPERLSWRDGTAMIDQHPLDVLVRFYQSEWLAALSERSGWIRLFRPAQTVVTNPGYSALTESKRLPLLWNQLGTPTCMLQKMFPQCCDPREVEHGEDEWVFKPAFSNTGDNVIIPALTDRAMRSKVLRKIVRDSQRWIAQKRFVPLAVTAASGAQLFPCIGVYTINGKATGAYARLSRGFITDYRALEAALLIHDDDDWKVP